MLDEPLVKLCQDNGEIFFRSSDITRFQRVFGAVVDEAQHLLVTSHYDGVIDHYGKMMLNRLKMRSGMVVETYMPASTEALVTRFNELVNSISMEEARGERAAQAPGRIIVVNDPKAIDSDGWALLSRLVTDFPGLNMRLVFLLDRIPANIEKALDRFGSRLLRWEVEPPTSEEQLVLRKEGMAEGLELQVERVLSRINLTLSQQLEPGLSVDNGNLMSQIDVGDSLGGSTEAGEREADDMRALFEEEQPSRRSLGLVSILLIIVLATGAAVIGGFVSPEIGQKFDNLLALTGVQGSVFTKQTESHSVVEAAYDSSNQNTPVVLPADKPKLPELSAAPENSDRQLPELSDPLNENSASETEPSTEPVQISPETEVSTSPQIQQLLIEESEPVVESVLERPSDDAVEDQPRSDLDLETAQVTATTPTPSVDEEAIAVVKGSNPSHQFVQHIVLASRARANAWIETQRGLNDAIVVPILAGGKRQYAVVSGPFDDRIASRTYIQGLAQDADYWVRTAGSLQRILQDGD